jgi:bifunctional pyridoxal-dependent enzyme with beta-cystathionase and maltose regulon repressor activities
LPQVCAYPAYQSLYELALSRGCTLDFWEPSWDAAAGKLRFDPSRLEELVSGGGGAGGGDSAMSDGGGAAEVGEAVKRPRLVVVNWPHNPTGATLSRADQGRVVEACRAAGSYLFSDEMYWRSGGGLAAVWAGGHAVAPGGGGERVGTLQGRGPRVKRVALLGAGG